MGEILAGVGDLVFTMLVGYIGALEFLYVVRHLYHWTFRHPNNGSDNDNDNDADSLKRLQENMRQQLATAEAREADAGTKAMEDGVLYKDGFRIDPQQQQIEQLKQEQRLREEKERRRKEIEAELARQKKIEEETRQQLQRAEAELEQQRQRQQEAALVEAERERERQQRELEEKREAEESARKMLTAEREREEAERKREETEREREEEERKREETERERVKDERQRVEADREREEAERKILVAEREREEAQRLMEEQERADEELAMRLVAAERQREAEERRLEEEREAEHQLRATEREREQLQMRAERGEVEQEEHEAEAAEQSQLLLDAEREQERKQRLKEENARKFLEAEEEMVALQQNLEEGAVLQRQVSVVEEPCVRREIAPLMDTVAVAKTQTVKTQLGQNSGDSSYSSSPKSLVFPDISDDGTSLEPTSSQVSSFSSHPSDELTIPSGDDSAQTIGLEREAPDGEDTAPPLQYTDDYLRSLDGIKQRPLVREDGTGRRRAFKKRRSSGSSNSSRDSRTSREDEIRMFTSLEEEEMKSAPPTMTMTMTTTTGDGVGDGEGDFTDGRIKYSSEPTLKVTKGHHHHRRHKRSPAKDAMNASNESLGGSLEMLGEESTDPWGEVVPEHYKDTAFWKREKAVSIDEEEFDLERTTVAKEQAQNAPMNVAKALSFEDATEPQNAEALTTLQKTKKKKVAGEKDEDTRHKDTSDEATRNDKNTNTYS